MKFAIILTGIFALFLSQEVFAQTDALTPAQKTEAANVVAAEYRLQRAWGAAIYGIQQPMEDIAGLVALFKLCTIENKKFGDEITGGEWYRLSGSDCPVKYERNQTWKGTEHDTHIAFDEVDDDTFYSTTDPRVLAELNISSISVSWDIRLKEPSPFRKSFEIDFLGYGKVKAEGSESTVKIGPDVKKISQLNKFTLPSIVVEANAFSWFYRNEPTKNFSEYLINVQAVDKKEYEKFRLL